MNMNSWRLIQVCALVLGIMSFEHLQVLQGQVIPVQGPAEPPKSPFPPFEKVLEGTKKIEGLFNLYFDAEKQKLFMEIRKDQYNKDIILPISIARGAGLSYLGGDTLNFGDQWVIQLRRVSDKIFIVRRNLKFTAEPGTPLADAVKTSYNDSIIDALPIKSELAAGNIVLIDLADLLMSDLAGIGIMPDPVRSTWAKVKAFPDNVEIEVSAVFADKSAGRSRFRALVDDDSIADPRGAQVVIHYGLSYLPKSSFKPRVADDRLGHFITSLNDFSREVNETPKVRFITRWNLEKLDPTAKLSPPKKPIIFWIEKSIPLEYRPYVRAGILEWNKTFEKIGFLEAIQCRDQLALDEFDAEDIRYNTIRWITTSAGFAMGPSRTNPLTGEILDADIIFDEGMIRAYRNEYVRTMGVPQGLNLLFDGQVKQFYRMHAGSVPELALSEKYIHDYKQIRDDMLKAEADHQLLPSMPRQPDWLNSKASCNCCMMGQGMQHQVGLFAAHLSAIGAIEPGGKIPPEYIGQVIKEVVMHEVGHTLGLRHNFKSSTILSLDQIRDPSITTKQGMAGSIMDYTPAYFAPKDKKQGEYFSSTLGPYDYWVIEYAYTPGSPNETEILEKIASRSAEPQLAFATDEDMSYNPDPRINLFDLGDPLEFAAERIKFSRDTMVDLEKRVVAKGEGYQRARKSFLLLLSDVSQSATFAANYLGGEYTSRDHKGDPNAQLPMTPISLETQKKALNLLAEEILSAKAFNLSPELLRVLAPEHHLDASHDKFYVPIRDVIARIQTSVIDQALNNDTLKAIEEIELHAKADEKVLQLPDVFNALSTACFEELKAPVEQGKAKTVIGIRRDLQHTYVNRLSQLVLGQGGGSLQLSGMLMISSQSRAPADARSLARKHLKQILADIKATNEQTWDEQSVAHFAELTDFIEQTLSAKINRNSP